MKLKDILRLTLVILTSGLIITLVLNEEKFFGDLSDAEMLPLRIATMITSLLCLIIFRRWS